MLANVKNTAAATYTLAVVPRLPSAVAHQKWAPLAEYLSSQTGLTLQLQLYKSIPNFERDLKKGSPDFAFMNPYHFLVARRTNGYIALVRDSADDLQGILVVRRDGPISDVTQLDGKTLAFPAPNAFAASLYMRALLTEQSKIRVEPQYVGSHSNVYRNVILGFAAAGGGINFTLKNEPPEVREQLRVIYETPKTAAHPLAVHPRVPPAHRQAVLNALLKMTRDPAAQALLDNVQLSKPVQADYARDYAPLEKLGLEQYVIEETEP